MTDRIRKPTGGVSPPPSYSPQTPLVSLESLVQPEPPPPQYSPQTRPASSASLKRPVPPPPHPPLQRSLAEFPPLPPPQRVQYYKPGTQNQMFLHGTITPKNLPEILEHIQNSIGHVNRGTDIPTK